MANVMLKSESSTDPSKPFKIRIQELRTLYDGILTECTSLLGESDKKLTEGVKSEPNDNMNKILKALDDFNAACDDVFKEVHRRRQRQLNSDEGMLQPHEMHNQLQVVGNLTQLLGDFRRYLETGEQAFVSLNDFRASQMLASKSPAPPNST